MPKERQRQSLPDAGRASPLMGAGPTGEGIAKAVFRCARLTTFGQAAPLPVQWVSAFLLILRGAAPVFPDLSRVL